MRLPSIAALAATAAIAFNAPAALAADAYEPAAGNEVVVYTHRFTPETFEEGLRLVKEGFTEAQGKLGQTRRNFFLVNPEQHDVVVVSFFAEGESVEAWHDFAGRMEVLQTLEPMRRSPLELERFTVDAVTTAP